MKIMARRDTWMCAPDSTPQIMESLNKVGLEQFLENWIKCEPALLGAGYVIVGQQVSFDGGPADLVAIDPTGSWVIIEIKRSENQRQDIAQALDYASSLASESAETLVPRLLNRVEALGHPQLARDILNSLSDNQKATPREVIIHLVGVGATPNVDRISEYLSNFELEVRRTSFEAHKSPDDLYLLTVEHEEPETAESETVPGDLTSILRRAEDFGVSQQFNRWLSIMEEAELFQRAYKRAVMTAPPAHKGLYLAVAEPVQNGIRISFGTDTFHRYFPWIGPNDAADIVGDISRGIGRTYAGAELDEAMDKIELFLKSKFPPSDPLFHAIFYGRASWNPEQFLFMFQKKPIQQRVVEQLFDAVPSPDCIVFHGSSFVGQAHLKFVEDGIEILQVRSTGEIRGMWTFAGKTAPSDDSRWTPLKNFFNGIGGLGPKGEAKSVSLTELSGQEICDLISIAKLVANSFAS